MLLESESSDQAPFCILLEALNESGPPSRSHTV